MSLLCGHAGISHVRIPVAYWYWDVAGDEPFPVPNMNDNDPNSPLFYLKRLLVWLEAGSSYRDCLWFLSY